MEGAPIRVGSVPWSESLKLSISMWYSWAFLTPLILWADRHLPVERDALVKRFLVHIPLSMLFVTAYTYVYHLIAYVIHMPVQAIWLADGPVLITLKSFTRSNNMVYWAIVAVGVSFEYQRFLKDQELRAMETQRLLSEARLSALRAQLHPHFLFNALNAVADYVDTDPKVARWMLEHLGHLLRVLTNSIDEREVPLAEELEFLTMYLELQVVRFGDRLSIEFSVEPDVLNALVPPLILQPIVENAIIHGPLTQVAQSAITVSAWRTNGSLHLQVRDNGPGFRTLSSPDQWAGVGLRNTKKRLESLYGVKHCAMDVSNDPNGGARLELTLPLQLDEPIREGANAREEIAV